VGVRLYLCLCVCVGVPPRTGTARLTPACCLSVWALAVAVFGWAALPAPQAGWHVTLAAWRSCALTCVGAARPCLPC